MSAGVLIPVADHGDLVMALPFVAPALLIVATIAILRLRERKRHHGAERE